MYIFFKLDKITLINQRVNKIPGHWRLGFWTLADTEYSKCILIWELSAMVSGGSGVSTERLGLSEAKIGIHQRIGFSTGFGLWTRESMDYRFWTGKTMEILPDVQFAEERTEGQKGFADLLKVKQAITRTQVCWLLIVSAFHSRVAIGLFEDFKHLGWIYGIPGTHLQLSHKNVGSVNQFLPYFSSQPSALKGLSTSSLTTSALAQQSIRRTCSPGQSLQRERGWQVGVRREDGQLPGENVWFEGLLVTCTHRERRKEWLFQMA